MTIMRLAGQAKRYALTAPVTATWLGNGVVGDRYAVRPGADLDQMRPASGGADWRTRVAQLIPAGHAELWT